MFTNPRVSNKMDGSQDVKKGITIWEGERGWQVPYDNDRLCVCVCGGGVLRCRLCISIEPNVCH